MVSFGEVLIDSVGEQSAAAVCLMVPHDSASQGRRRLGDFLAISSK
jgi:hypothetical protein